MFDYDAELRHYHERLQKAVDFDLDDRLLDTGCGTGQPTRAASRVAPGGHALGIDVSSPMLTQARRLAKRERLTNARSERGDAQTHPLPAEHFTIDLSRFGTMFFADPATAFTNIATALRPGARFVQLVWRDIDRQEWHTAVQQALTAGPGVRLKPAKAAAFSLADRRCTRF